MNHCRKQHGFTLLEAIVALVLVATVGMALLNWLNTLLTSVNSMQQAQRRTEATRNALALLDQINPMLTPTGQREVGIYTFRWQAEPLRPALDGVNNLGAQGLYKLNLYQTQLDVLYQNQLVTRLSLRQVGYEQVRLPSVLGADDF